MLSSPPESFRQKTVEGIGWSVFSRFGAQAMQFILGIILARLLTPEAFGLIAMIVAFTGFATLFTDLGFSAALIHKQDATPTHYYSIFWLNVSVGLLLMVLFMGSAPLLVWFYDEPRLLPLILLLSTNFFIGSLGIIQSTRLKKALDFRKLALVELAALSFSGIIGIILAILDQGVWSLAIQSVLMTCCTVLLLWMVSDWRPALLLNRASVRELAGFSTNLLGFSTINYWFRNADNLLIGRFLGTGALGVYSRAYAIMLLPLRSISHTIGQVIFPAFATIQEDKQRVARTYLRIIRAVALLTFPLMTGLLIISEHFVLGLFGPQWSQMIPVLRLFCIVSIIQSILTLNGNIYQSQGRTDVQLRVGGSVGVLGIVAILLGLPYGVVGVALSYCIYTLLIAFPSLHYAVSLVDLKVRDVCQDLIGTFLCSTVMGLLVWFIGWVLPPGWPHWLFLLLQIPLGIATFWGLVHFTRLDAYLDVLAVIREQWQNHLSTVAPPPVN